MTQRRAPSPAPARAGSSGPSPHLDVGHIGDRAAAVVDAIAGRAARMIERRGAQRDAGTRAMSMSPARKSWNSKPACKASTCSGNSGKLISLRTASSTPPRGLQIAGPHAHAPGPSRTAARRTAGRPHGRYGNGSGKCRSRWRRAILHQRVAERPDAGAGIEDQRCARRSEPRRTACCRHSAPCPGRGRQCFPGRPRIEPTGRRLTPPRHSMPLLDSISPMNRPIAAWVHSCRFRPANPPAESAAYGRTRRHASVAIASSVKCEMSQGVRSLGDYPTVGYIARGDDDARGRRPNRTVGDYCCRS